mgnify:CR=1 FL=1
MYKVIILAAGQGTRLRPYTNSIPKGLVKFRNVSLINRQIEILKNDGINEIFIIGGYKYHLLKELKCKLLINKNYKKTNMVRTLFEAKKLFNDDCDLLISYSDIIYQSNIIENLKETQGDIVVISDKGWEKLWSKRMKNYHEDVESFKTSSDGLIKEIGKKIKNQNEIEAQYIGLIKISKGKQKEILDIYNKSFSESNYDNLDMTSFLQHLIDLNFNLKPAFISNGWLEFDSTKDLKKYNSLQDKNKLQELYKIEEYNKIDQILNKINSRKYIKEEKDISFSIINFIKIIRNNKYKLDNKLIKKARIISRKIEISNNLYYEYYYKDFTKNYKSRTLSNDLIILLLASFLKIYFITNDIIFLNTILKGIDRHIKDEKSNKNLKILKEITNNELITYYEN